MPGEIWTEKVWRDFNLWEKDLCTTAEQFMAKFPPQHTLVPQWEYLPDVGSCTDLTMAERIDSITTRERDETMVFWNQGGKKGTWLLTDAQLICIIHVEKAAGLYKTQAQYCPYVLNSGELQAPQEE